MNEVVEHDLMKIASNFIDANKKFKFLEPDFTFEVIDDKYTDYIIKWRNEPSNFKFFADQDKLTKAKQQKFLKNYSSLNRIDFILVGKKNTKTSRNFFTYKCFFK